jgi:hypothetical protein
LTIDAALPHAPSVAQSFLTVIETTRFTRTADELLTADERAELILLLASNLQLGDEISGTGGV